MRALFAVAGRWLADERGDAAIIEILLWLPVAIVLLSTISVALRQDATASIAQDAAEAAARAARIGVSAPDGQRRAEQSLAASFAGQPGRCDGQVDTAGWDAGTVEVTVTCDADFAGLASVTPGRYRVTRTWTETIDAARRLRTGS